MRRSSSLPLVMLSVLATVACNTDLPTELPPVDEPLMDVIHGGQGNGATFEPNPYWGVAFSADGYRCRMRMTDIEGNFLLTTPSGIGLYKERQLHDALFTVWTPSGDRYEGTGNYNAEGRWPEPPITFTGTARVTNTADPTDTRRAVCKWVRKLNGRETVFINLN